MSDHDIDHRDHLGDFRRYALAFERGFAENDWRHVDEQLVDDAAWAVQGAAAPFGGVADGREAVLRAIRSSCDAFDRRFDRRVPRIVEGPIAIPGGVYFRFVVTYQRDGLPAIDLRGEEWDFFRDGKLEHHREKLLNVDEILSFLERHGAALRPPASVG